MKDIFNNDLIVDKEYLFYNDDNRFTRICYGMFKNITNKGYATLEVTKRIVGLYNGSLEEDTRSKIGIKVSVKPFKLIPNEITKQS